MTQVIVYHYDAFSPIPGQGNPAGIVFDALNMTEQDMQLIARQVGFNETVFVLPSDQADVRLRYFTPGHEMNLCGHATIAAFFALHKRKLLSEAPLPRQLTVETKAGLLPIGLNSDAQGQLFIRMSQAPAQFLLFQGDLARLAIALGLTVEDLASNWPIVYGSTGLWTLLVPVKGLAAMQQMQPHNSAFPRLLTQLPHASVHPFCFETLDPAAQIHGRHFSSPFSGTVEDPVTGTASGVLGAYWMKYIQRQKRGSVLVEQGQEVGRDGRVRVEVTVTGEDYQVNIYGTAAFVKELVVIIEGLTFGA